MNIFQRLWYQRQHKKTEHAPLFQRYQGDELVSLDCETTSLDPNRAELVTIAATKIKANQILTSQSLSITLRAPGSLDGNSVAIHRLRHQDLHHGEEIIDALKQLLDFIGNRPIVGYHIQYDKQILDRYFQRYFHFPLPNRIVEVSYLYQQRLERMLPNAYCDLSLDSMSKQLNLPLPERHDAMQDAIAAALIYVRLKHGGMPSITSS